MVTAMSLLIKAKVHRGSSLESELRQKCKKVGVFKGMYMLKVVSREKTAFAMMLVNGSKVGSPPANLLHNNWLPGQYTLE